MHLGEQRELDCIFSLFWDIFIFKIYLQWWKFCCFSPPHLGRLFREIRSARKGLLDLNFSKAWRCWNRNQLPTWHPWKSPTDDVNPALLPSGFPLFGANTALMTGIAQIQGSLTWKGVLLAYFESGFVYLSAAAKWLRSLSVWPSEDMLSTCCPQLWSSSLPSGSSLWNGDFFFSCSGCTGVSDILQESSPIALQYFAGQTTAADSEKCMAFGYWALRKNSCI